MKEVEPRVYLIGRSQPQKDEIRQWLDSVGADQYKIEDDVTGGEQLVQLAGKRCYMSFQPGLNPNVTRVRSDMTEFIDNILKVGHGSVLEHAVYNFAIEGVSRVFTGEMNRHRAGMAISEGSMRFIRFNDIPFWFPPSIKVQIGDTLDVVRKKEATRMVFMRLLSSIEEGYSELEEIWDINNIKNFSIKKHLTSMFRRIIPMGVATGGVWSGNIRALRHIFTMRCEPAAEEEILIVACKMLEKMKEAEPTFFKDFELVEGYWRPKYRKV